MPLLDIAVAQSSFQNFLGSPRVQRFVNGELPNYSLLQCEERWALFQRSFQILGTMNLNLVHQNKLHSKFLIKAVATFEPKCHVLVKDGDKDSNVLSTSVESMSTVHTESSSEDSDLDEREKMRRLRISKANKGNTPWNKGRKHSPETLKRIKERTKLAMQDPKVKMKLANIGHAQSEKTREKIAVGVRLGWERRRKKLLLQETCLFDWQNLLAEAARKGFHEEEELQWDSYKLLNDKLHQEWLDSIEYRKTAHRPKGSKRAPKSLEQRRKIAEAIAAKWADPEYRTRVTSGLAKYYGTPEGAEKRVRRKPSGEAQTARTAKKKAGEGERSMYNELRVKPQQPKKKRNAPKYKDPLASYKLEMLKSIRAQRVASETKKNEALQQAKLLIEEAGKAAKALEVAATRSPVAQASLIETRKLIAEAIQSIESIENKEPTSQDDNSPTAGNQNDVEKSTHVDANNNSNQSGVNGIVSGQSSKGQNSDFNLYELTTADEMDMKYHLPTDLSGYKLPKLSLDSLRGDSNSSEIIVDRHQPEPNGGMSVNGASPNSTQLLMQDKREDGATKTLTKKWVCGRLVEIVEGE